MLADTNISGFAYMQAKYMRERNMWGLLLRVLAIVLGIIIVLTIPIIPGGVSLGSWIFS